MLIPLEPMKCPNCKYEWYTKSKRLVIACPNCRLVFAREKNLFNNKEGEASGK